MKHNKLAALRGLFSNIKFHLNAVTIGLATGTLGLMYPNLSFAAGIGTTAKNAATEFSVGGTAALKVLVAFGGLCMVAYSVYGMTLGRKKDEREYPMGRTLGVGLGGAILLSLTAAAGIMNETAFGSDKSSTGIDLVE